MCTNKEGGSCAEREGAEERGTEAAWEATWEAAWEAACGVA